MKGGSLCLRNGTLSATTVAADEAATVELVGTTLSDGAEVTVPAGATLRLADVSDSNLVADGSFEKNTTAGAVNVDARIGSDWKIEIVVTNRNNTQVLPVSGVQGYGGNVTPDNRPPAVEGAGAYSAAIRGQVRINQTVSVPETGRYRLTFVSAKRYRSDYVKATLKICPQIDGEDLAAVALSDEEFKKVALMVELTAGEHVLSFYVDSDWQGEGGPMAFVDLVRLSRVLPLSDMSDDATVNLSAGSRLRLDNVMPVRIVDLRVDGERITGGRQALADAGIVIEGEGVLHAGERKGLTIIFR